MFKKAFAIFIVVLLGVGMLAMTFVGLFTTSTAAPVQTQAVQVQTAPVEATPTEAVPTTLPRPY